MVVNVDASRLSQNRDSGIARLTRRTAQNARRNRADECVTIGLLNNMAGTAFQATERQFVGLLDAASDDIPIQVSFYALPGLATHEPGEHRLANRYGSVDSLLNSRLDGLIVTGREPMMPSLRDEPYWEDFTRILDWARANTYSSMWSCLAAHAAILHMDGIDRRKGEAKTFGVFDCIRVSDHPLMQGLPTAFHIPHSRWNGVLEQDLAARGYTVVSHIGDGGIDIFVKQEKSLLVFLQGHPEYESDTLMREYRRDVQRYLRSKHNAFPQQPHGYFDRETEAALRAVREQGHAGRNQRLPSIIAAATAGATIRNTWHSTASRICRNWLECICARKLENKRELLACADKA